MAIPACDSYVVAVVPSEKADGVVIGSSSRCPPSEWTLGAATVTVGS